MQKGRLFVISGPSGVGKGTIVHRLRGMSDRIRLSVSATTRSPREGETDGVSYFFMTDGQFGDMVANGGFLEHASVHGHSYGTPKAPVTDALEEGDDIILEIDVQGAMQVKKSFDDGVFIFILPPSMKALAERIRGRGTETDEDIRLRLGKAMEEIRYLRHYDYYVINDELDDAVDLTAAIIRAEHFRTKNMADIIIKKYEEDK